MLGEAGEQAEFDRGQMYLLPGANHVAAFQIDLDLAELNDRSAARCGTCGVPKGVAYPRDQRLREAVTERVADEDVQQRVFDLILGRLRSAD